MGGDFMKIIFEIFLSIFKIGAFTFGGGYAMIPLIEQEVVNNKKWLNKDEFMDVLVVAQSLPGAMAINASIFLGYRIAGILGAISALIAVILPSFIIIILIAAFFMQFRNNYYVNAAFMGITAAVPMLVLVGAISLAKGIPKNLRSLITILISLIVLIFFHINPVVVIIVSGVYGAIFLRGKV
jgi:chromate transporter